METYLTEEERVEALQRWWKENKSSIVMGLALGIAVVVGWNMWNRNRAATAVQASHLYQEMLEAAGTRQTESAIKLGERLAETYSSTAYAEYARLLIAKEKAESGDLAGARKALEDVLAKTSDDNVKHLARLRLARALLAAGETEPALKLVEPLSPSQTGKFAGLYDELKGDLYVAAKRPEDARKAYEDARETGEASPLLELKLNDLPAPPKSPTP